MNYRYYQLTGRLTFPAGTEFHLTYEQYTARQHSVTAISGAPGVVIAIEQQEFKAGEVVGLREDRVLSAHEEMNLQPDPSDESPGDGDPDGAGAAKVKGRKVADNAG